MINKIVEVDPRGNFAKRAKAFFESQRGRKRMAEIIRQCQADCKKFEDAHRVTPEQWKTPFADF